MKLRVDLLDAELGDLRVVFIPQKVAEELDLIPGGKARLYVNSRETTVLIAVNGSQGKVLRLSKKLFKELGEPKEVDLKPHIVPASVTYIRKKLDKVKLGEKEIFEIIKDVVSGVLTDVEIAAFVSAQLSVGMDINEIIYLTKAMVGTGNVLKFDKPVYDIHSIGGVPGNSKVSIVAVPTIASAGIFIPKTSSRAITSPAGTADTMEVFAPVEFTADEVTELAKKVNGFIIWGGTLGLAPADDILIKVEYQLRVDPVSQMVASILSKKLSMSVQNLLIDIPTGREAKVESLKEARNLASLFTQVGNGLGLSIRVGITYGGQPIGYAIGPALEAREALESLMGKGPTSVREKATAIAGLILEMAGQAPKGAGKKVAKEILRSGKSLEVFKEMVNAMGGNPEVKPEDIEVGKHRVEIKAPMDGYVTGVYNKPLTIIARAAGAPVDKGAGILLHVKRGHKVKEGQVLMEIYSNSAPRLQEATKLVSTLKPISIEGMLLETYPEYV